MRGTPILLLLVLMVGGFASGYAQPLSSGGGPAASWLALNLSDLNNHLTPAGLPELEPGIPVFGVAYSGDRREGFALGGLAASGVSEASRLDETVQLSLQLAGLTVEYGEPASENLGIFVGGLLAPASLTLATTLHPAEGFDSGLEKPSGMSLTRRLFALEIYAGGEWALGKGRLRLSLGYLWAAAMTNWKTNGRDIPGPLERLRGPLVQTSLMLSI